jgi:tRNA A37 threonylcarbamoyladenosine dehydratase
MDNRAFDRNELLLGRGGVEMLAKARVILFGVGGVGSWCAEALIRSGVGHLVVVDNDVVCETNINRQLQATFPNLGRSKVEALKERLLQINPQVQVDAVAQLYNLESSTGFDLGSYDYVIDAIDSLSHKVGLIAQAMESGTTLFSAMGAACKLDPARIRTASIWETQGCKLARVVRKRLRRRGVEGDCLCVYSEELIESREEGVHGSMVHMTGIFGFQLAGLVVQDVYRRSGE